jgi:hypothetical protein
MQLIISSVTPLDWAMQVEYSCVISLSAAATGGLLKKSPKPITTTALICSRPFPSLLHFDAEIILIHLQSVSGGARILGLPLFTHLLRPAKFIQQSKVTTLRRRGLRAILRADAGQAETVVVTCPEMVG